MPVKPFVEYIKQNFREGDIIAHSNPATEFLFKFYCNDLNAEHYYFIVPEAQEIYWRKIIIERIGSDEDEYRKVIIPDELGKYNFKRIWLISSAWGRNYKLDQNSIMVILYLQRFYKLAERKWISGVLVSLYEK
jgi:hypothetical protein